MFCGQQLFTFSYLLPSKAMHSPEKQDQNVNQQTLALRRPPGNPRAEWTVATGRYRALRHAGTQEVLWALTEPSCPGPQIRSNGTL